MVRETLQNKEDRLSELSQELDRLLEANAAALEDSVNKQARVVELEQQIEVDSERLIQLETDNQTLQSNLSAEQTQLRRLKHS